VAGIAVVFHVGDSDGHGLRIITNRSTFGDFSVADRRGHTLAVLHFHDSSSQGRLTMIDVPNRADVHVRLRPLKIFFCHAVSCSFVVYVIRLFLY
jgi:hypothetical protein